MAETSASAYKAGNANKTTAPISSWNTTKTPKPRLGLAVFPLRVRMMTVMDPAANDVITRTITRSAKLSMKPEARLPAMAMAAQT
jgi:hypothetical protein